MGLKFVDQLHSGKDSNEVIRDYNGYMECGRVVFPSNWLAFGSAFVEEGLRGSGLNLGFEQWGPGWRIFLTPAGLDPDNFEEGKVLWIEFSKNELNNLHQAIGAALNQITD